MESLPEPFGYRTRKGKDPAFLRTGRARGY
jgi:hypothetical protein